MNIKNLMWSNIKIEEVNLEFSIQVPIGTITVNDESRVSIRGYSDLQGFSTNQSYMFSRTKLIRLDFEKIELEAYAYDDHVLRKVKITANF